MDDLAMIVSPTGKLYIVDKGKLVCSYRRKWESMYSFRQHVDEASDFVDAKIDDEEIVLYHHTNSTQKIIPSELWNSDEKFQHYVWAYFGIGAKVKSVQQTVNVDRFGKPIDDDDDEIEAGPFYRITRRDFTVLTTNWHLKFSRFEASCYFDEEYSSLEVFPSFDKLSFEHVSTMLGVECDTDICSDVWFDELVSAKLDIKIPLDKPRVFKAVCGGVDVVVKRLEAAETFSPVCLQIWSTNTLKTFHRPKGALIKDDVCYLVFDHFTNTLDTHLQSNIHTPEVMPTELINYFRGIVKALMLLHDLGFCHNNLKPHNIFLEGETVLLGGLSKAEIFTRQGLGKDLRALAKLIISSLSKRNHPWTEKAYDDKVFSAYSMYAWAVEAQDIALKLQSPSVTLQEVMYHPWLFIQDNRISYICVIAQVLAGMYCDRDMSLKKNRREFFKEESWREVVPPKLMEYMDKWKPTGVSKDDSKDHSKGDSKDDAKDDVDNGKDVDKDNVYNGWNPRHLLEFARNVFCHYMEIRKIVKEIDCLESDQAFELQLSVWFPKLLIGTYSYVERLIKQTKEEDRGKFNDVINYHVIKGPITSDKQLEK